MAGRVRTVEAQATALAALDARLVLLQEVRSTALPAWTRALGERGYPHVLAALAAGPPDRDPARRLGVLIASRGPLRALDPPPLPWPERYLAATIEQPIALDVHCVHVPTSSRADRVKVRTLEALAATLAPPGPRPTIVAGDLNTPQYESREGEVRSFARTRTGRLREGFDERHDAAELGLVPGLERHGFADAFRAVHGYAARDRSWTYARGGGYRLDHLFVRGLGIAGCGYLHEWRQAGLSDHSALWAVLAG